MKHQSDKMNTIAGANAGNLKVTHVPAKELTRRFQQNPSTPFRLLMPSVGGLIRYMIAS
jgi:hypothetical protein